MKKTILFVAMLCIFMNHGLAQEGAEPVSKPDSHAPIGVMGDHLHKKGEFMFSYRYRRMSMKDNLIGTNEVSPETIVTTVANPFAGNPGMPPTLRVVPMEMTMDMHMIGMMFAPSDKVTLMAMTMVMTNDMDHITYQGGMGTTQLGTFNVRTSGLSDLKLSALVHLFTKENTRAHLNLGVSIPTGSVTETAQVLTPMNMEPTLRTPYPMQLGSGTFDLLPGVTYSGSKNKLGWGTQLMADIRTGENDEGYSLGNRFEVSTWVSYRLAMWVSGSFRLYGLTAGTVDGVDPNIMAPVQTADTDNQGGERVDAVFGLNLIGQRGFLREQRLACEFGLPMLQDLNGPQLKTRSVFTIGWQYAFGN
jgi:hypothetical protein